MKASEILHHFLSQADWIQPERTVDKIIVGDPDREVQRILVSWISSLKSLKVAVDKKVDMFITHEPTFYEHANELEAIDRTTFGPEKKRFIEEAGFVILRNHDCWDRWPECGIPWAWAQFLGLPGQPVTFGHSGYQHRYDIDPVPVGELARRIAGKTVLIGEPAVQLTGDPETVVSKIGIGTGCGCNIPTYIDMGCDVSVVCDDGSCYWREIQCAEDMGHPVIRVNHGTSEEPGMVTLTQYINENFPGVQAEHLPHGATFCLIGSEACPKVE